MISLVKVHRQRADDKMSPSRDELAVLAEAAVRGDPHAVRTFTMAVAGTLRGAVRMVLGPQHSDVDDVTQEAAMGLLSALPRFRGECTVAQYARRVAVLTAMAARRRQHNQERWTVVDDAARDGVSSAPASSPLAQGEAARRRSVMRRLLDDLPEALGEAMVHYFMLGHTAEEIAAMTHVPVSTVWSRLRMGKARLRQKLADDPSLCEALAASEHGVR